ncbi:MAG TPA: hypothetical protein VHK88_20190 [Aquihabitans sp.]|jgi:hypothetical protein|nr:hypothetical protein [Aquihabitans sp.]
MTETITVDQRSGSVVVDQRPGTVIVRDVVLAGTQGASAYQVAVANGFVGTEAEWLETLVGPAGPASGGAYHVQGAASATWTINHDLGFLPNVTIRDTEGNEVLGLLIDNSTTATTIHFPFAMTGNATLS